MNIRTLTKRFAFLTRLSYGKQIHPSRDWLILLGVSLAMLIGFALWSTWVFMEGADPSAEQAATSTAPTLSPRLLEDTNALFERRAEEEARYRGEYRFVDPSRPGS